MSTVQIVATDEHLLRAVKMVGEEAEPLPIPRGVVGGCVACNRPVASHFTVDGNGRIQFLGCLEGTDQTVYVLAPAVATTTREQRMNGTKPQAKATASDRKRRYKVARYFSKLHHKAKVEKVRIEDQELADVQKKVLVTIHSAYTQGVRAKDIIKKAHLSHGAVQSTLSWLREQKLVEAREDKLKTSSKQPAA